MDTDEDVLEEVLGLRAIAKEASPEPEDERRVTADELLERGLVTAAGVLDEARVGALSERGCRHGVPSAQPTAGGQLRAAASWALFGDTSASSEGRTPREPGEFPASLLRGAPALRMWLALLIIVFRLALLVIFQLWQVLQDDGNPDLELPVFAGRLVRNDIHGADRSGPAALVAFIKLVVYPGLVYLGLTRLGVTGTDLQFPVLIMASPTAVVSYIMAVEMKGDGRLAGAIVTGTTLGSLVTISAWLAFFKFVVS